MKTIFVLVLLLMSIRLSIAGEVPAEKPVEAPVFREPFTLSLQVDKERKYEEKFDKVPYVYEGEVYLFKGDKFGLNLETQDGAIKTVKYQPDLEKAEVTLEFSQEVQTDGTSMMMLVLHNNTKQVIDIDAVMSVPGKKGVAETSIMPLEAGLSGYESWPHPIVQLVLRNLRFGK